MNIDQIRRKRLVGILDAIGLGEDCEYREDSAFTAVLDRQLEHVKTTMYEKRYPELRARQLIPVSHEADPGDETITYQMWDYFGMAVIISNMADDLPLVDALAEKKTSGVVSMGSAYQYSIQDLRRAAKSGVPLTTRKAAITRRVVEYRIEDIAAFGDEDNELLGMTNHPNVAIYPPTTGNWASATGMQIAQDLLNWLAAIVNANKQTFIPDTIAIDITSYNRLATKPTSTTGDGTYTALRYFREVTPYPVEIIPWNKLALANSAGNGPRAVAYMRNPEVLTLEIPQEYEQMDPQAKNLAYVVNTHARCGGVIVYYPIAMGYMDGI